MQRVQGGVDKLRECKPLRQTRRRRRIAQNLQQLADDFMEEEAELLEHDTQPCVSKRQLTDRLKLALYQAQMLLDNQSRTPTAGDSSLGGQSLALGG